MKRFIFFAIVGILPMLIVACGGSKPEPANITIDMTEFAFSPNAIELEVGQDVTLNLVNTGALGHELMIGRDVMMMDNHPGGYRADLFETAGVEPNVEMGAMGMDEHDEKEMHSGFMVALPENGGTATMKFTVTEDMVGEWEIGCFEQEGVHYTAGMVGTLVVKP